jgi:hypothetical protein
MADGFSLAEFVDVRLNVECGDGEVFMEKTEEAGFTLGLDGFGIVLKGEELNTVACGEDKAFADAGLVNEGAGGVGEAAGGYSEAFPNLDGGGVVIDAE